MNHHSPINSHHSLLALLLAATAALAQTNPPVLSEPPNAGKVLRADAVWPGMYFRVSHCRRIDAERVFIQFHVVNPPEAKGTVQVKGDGPDIIIWRTDENGKNVVDFTLPDPYVLGKAVVRDAGTGTPVKTLPARPEDPYPGESETTVPLRPDEAVEIGAYFSVPVSVQSPYRVLDIRLPQSKGEIKGIPVFNEPGIDLIATPGFRVLAAREIKEQLKSKTP